MTAGPISTPVKLAQCQKCNAYVFSATVAGLNAVINPAPLAETDDVRAALLEGKSLYHVRMVGGKPQKAVSVIGTQVGESIKHGVPLWAQHGCAAGGTVRASRVEVPPVGPQRAPVTPGEGRDGFRHPTAPVGGSQGHRAKISKQELRDYFKPRHHAGIVNPRPSRCIVCRGLLTGNEPDAVTIEYDGRIIWGYHAGD